MTDNRLSRIVDSLRRASAFRFRRNNGSADLWQYRLRKDAPKNVTADARAWVCDLLVREPDISGRGWLEAMFDRSR